MSRSLVAWVLLFTHFAGAYDLVKTYSGNTFFDEFTYMSDWDHWTGGDVQYQNRTAAGNLTTVNEAGNVVIRVDSWTDLRTLQYDEKRNSIRLEGTQIFNNIGTVVMYDVVHVPTGCSVWGSLWSKSGVQAWPKGGEVDIFEAVNKMPGNQMAFHTDTTCKVPQPNPNQSGSTILPDCQVVTLPDGTYTNGAGCTVSDPRMESYSNLAGSNGGVWVAEYAATAVNIWYFPRASVPSGLTSSQTIDTTTLGQPVANYPTTSACDITHALDPQHLVIDITLCGTWAGVTIADTCGALTAPNCYGQYVKDPANYVEAYFEITSIKLFGDATTLLQNGTTATTGGATSPATTTRTRSSTATIRSSSSTSAGFRRALCGLWGLLFAGLLVVASI